MTETPLFCLHKLSQRDRCLFLRFLAETKIIDEFMFEVKSANNLALGTERSFIERGLCPVSKRAEDIVDSAFPWDYTRDGDQPLPPEGGSLSLN